jgi:sporulation protein YlmC with PRC-barrel domain
MLGLPVVGIEGRLIGEVADLELHTASWELSGLVVRIPASSVVELGLPRPDWSTALVAIPRSRLVSAAQVVTLDITHRQLKECLSKARRETEHVPAPPIESD